MDILNEIIEASNHMLDALEETDFFAEAPFIDRIPLKRAVCKSVSENEIGKTIGDLVDKGALNMSINEDGEILYSANKDFQFEDYEDEDEIQ